MTMQQLAPNTVLKGSWVIDKKLGEGACAVVYSVKPTGPNTSSPVVDYVAKVVTAPVGKGAALKQKTVLYNLLYHEYMLHTGHFKGFSLSPQFPALPRFMYGEEEHTNVGRVRFLVMERLRFDLHSYIASLSDSGVQQVISSSSSNKIKGKAAATISTKLHSIVSYLGLQIMAGLQEIHSKGFVFVDVKPDNFMVNPNPTNPNQPRLYFIDFALAERYTAATSGSFHRANIPCAVPKGTPGYMSVSCQEGALPSRRDDIEAAVWVLLSLLLPAQELPWANSTSPAECLRLKKSCDIAALCVKYNCKEVRLLLHHSHSAARSFFSPSHTLTHTHLYSVAGFVDATSAKLGVRGHSGLCSLH